MFLFINIRKKKLQKGHAFKLTLIALYFDCKIYALFMSLKTK